MNSTGRELFSPKVKRRDTGNVESIVIQRALLDFW